MSTDPHEQVTPVIACNFGAIDPAERSQHMASADHIFASVIDIKETSNGYAFQLPLNLPMLYKTAAFINNERLCCSFFTFSLKVDQEMWLELSGTSEVKIYIHDNIVNSVRETGMLSPVLKEQIQAVWRKG
jgi:hypothetical protein